MQGNRIKGAAKKIVTMAAVLAHPRDVVVAEDASRVLALGTSPPHSQPILTSVVVTDESLPPAHGVQYKTAHRQGDQEAGKRQRPLREQAKRRSSRPDAQPDQRQRHDSDDGQLAAEN